MIALNSLKTNLLPNVYTKNITLDSAKLTNISSLLLSLKMVQDKNSAQGIAKLLSTELKDTFKIKLYQITDKNTFKSLHTQLKAQLEAKTNKLPGKQDHVKIIDLSMSNFLNPDLINQGAMTQTLSDGTILTQMNHRVNFEFDQSTDFLGYLTVVCVEHEDFEEIFFGSISGEIVILDGQLQTEGVVFTISLDQEGRDPSLFIAKYGKPGDTWVGGVHSHQGRFMAGATHTDAAHPYLDTNIIPVRKYADNRVKEKLQKNIINVTQAFEKISSLSVRIPSQQNLLDFESYKSKSYMSDIFLSQAGLSGPSSENPTYGADVNGAFFIDKEQLFKNQSAMAFLFQNAQALAQDGNEGYAEEFYSKMYNLGTLERLTVFENEELLNSINYALQTNQTFVSKMDPEAPLQPANSKCAITKENFMFENKEGIDQFTFKRYKSKQIDGPTTFKVKAEYKDPTVEYVKEMLSLLTKVIENIDTILTRTQITNSFDENTGQINEALAKKYISELDPTDAIDEAGNIRSLVQLITTSNFWVYFYNPNMSPSLSTEVAVFFLNSTNVMTATVDSLTLASSFLNELKEKIISNLKAFDKGSSKTNGTAAANQYGYLKANIDSKSAFSQRIIDVENSSHITLYNYAYNFVGEIPSTDAPVLTIKRDEYKARALILATEYLSSPAKLNLEATFKTKFGSAESMSDNLFSYLTIPKYLSTLRESVILPKTVIDMNQKSTNMESIFLGILKLNSHLLVNNFTQGDHVAEMREDLDTLLGVDFSTLLVDDSEILATKMNFDKQTPEILGAGGKLGFSNESISPSPAPDGFIIQKENLKTKQTNNNFILLSLLNKLIMSNSADNFNSSTQKQTFIPKVMKGSFVTTNRTATDAPVQAKVLNLVSDPESTFKNYKLEDEIYIENGVINPLFMCYYWLLHQNIVRVEYLSEFDSSDQTIFLKNQVNPYVVGPSKKIKERNTKEPVWKKLNLGILDSLTNKDKILCRLVRYESDYIDQTLVSKLNLPLYNNYFIIEG